MGWLEDEVGLEKCAANFVPLTPLSHLRRAALVFSDKVAIVYQDQKISYATYYQHCSRLASGLTKYGIKPGDVVATLLPNIPANAEAHFGVPACGAVLNSINTRLDLNTVTYILNHGAASALIVDSQFINLAEDAAKQQQKPPLIIEVHDVHSEFPASGRHLTYDVLLSEGDSNFTWIMPEDEWESLALNYTSGTTGKPKGVVYHHRGAYLMTMGTIISWRLVTFPIYLSIVPLFHCNGWNHTWMMPVLGGTLVCCREINAANIFKAISQENVTHFGAAPIILNMLVNASKSEYMDFDHIVEVFTAGAPPAPATLEKIEKMGFNVTHVYGLTETYGHVTECLWDDQSWGKLEPEKRAEIKARQGVGFPMMEDVTVVDDNMIQVPLDRETQGEIVMRGNSIMKGYFKNPQATEESFKNGFFHSEDIAVQHSDRYIQIADRAKDIIISGGENISSVEVEGVLMSHPSVLLAAVVAKPDEKWGEVPCAFIELKHDAETTESDLIAFTRNKLAGFKSPKKIIFAELPKTSTGKIQKFELRKVAANLD
ncbi:MAG: AMP-binding protein [Aestuariivita sp.]|nr:AMP-binding protein [Aestuariivita sp.]